LSELIDPHGDDGHGSQHADQFYSGLRAQEG